MMKLLPFMLFSSIAFSQKADLNQYSSFCKNEYDSEITLENKLNRLYRHNNYWRVEAEVIDDCGIKLYPNFKVVGNTLVIDLLEISETEITLVNGDQFIEVQQATECYCIYDMKMELLIDTIINLKINTRYAKFIRDK